MSTPSDDEIEEFFRDLVPEDLVAAPRSGSAAFKHADEDSPHHGSDMFEQFVLRHLSQTDREESVHFGVIHNGTAWRLFEMRDEELFEFLRRIAIASVQFGTQWLFMAVPGEPACAACSTPAIQSPSIGFVRRECCST